MSDPSNVPAAGRTANGRFAPGNSGGPGRPRGPINSGVTALDQIGAESGAELVRLAVDKARAGDSRALELVMERVWPRRRGRAIPFDLPSIRTIDDVVSAHTEVTDGVLAGQLTAQEASVICDVLERHRQLIADTSLAKAVGAAVGEAIEHKKRESEERYRRYEEEGSA
jgi:hypothetical protein